MGISRASLIVLEGEVGVRDSRALSVCSFVKFRGGAQMIFEWTDKTTLFPFTRTFLNCRVLPSLIFIIWFSSLYVASIQFVLSAMLKFSMLLFVLLLPVKFAVCETLATTTTNFPMGYVAASFTLFSIIKSLRLFPASEIHCINSWIWVFSPNI